MVMTFKVQRGGQRLSLKNNGTHSNLFLFFEMMIDIFHSALFTLSCHLGISMSYYFV